MKLLVLAMAARRHEERLLAGARALELERAALWSCVGAVVWCDERGGGARESAR